MQPTRLCIVRHGETAWNAEGRVQGQLDVPLNDIGLAQARAVAAALQGEHFTAIYSSDLQRVTRTAEPTAAMLGLPVQLDPRLRERHYGMFQTLTYADVKILHPEDYARFKAKDLDYDFRTGRACARSSQGRSHASGRSRRGIPASPFSSSRMAVCSRWRAGMQPVAASPPCASSRSRMPG
jgi:probable phosphoglycerate mutase